MRYLVKVFDGKRAEDILKSTLHVATDEGDERSENSIWYWLWQAKRRNVEISIYRLIEGVEHAKSWDEILIIDQEGKLIREWASNLKLAELSQDSSVEAYIIKCVLDLS